MNLGGTKSRKSSGSESGGDMMDRDDIWDDKLIIKNYDESLALFHEEVAKRLAMDTNKKVASGGKDAAKVPVDGVKIEAETTTDEGTNVTGTYEEEKGAIELSDGKATAFKLGEYVRATYEDGVDYEAKIIRIDRDNDCLIRYVGYNNEQIVQIEDLLPSWGRTARRQQRDDAAEANADRQMEVSDDEKLTKRASKIRIDFSPNMGRNEAGGRSSATPGASFMVPPPPPIPPMLEDADDAESENLSAMLMSWYMSGYYTGLYHGQRMAQQQQQQQHQKRARQS